VSNIHGIGVFAQQTIEAGTNVFASDIREIQWVPSSVLLDSNLADYQRAFYEDFAIRRGDQLGCPANFNLLTVGWYVNEPSPGEAPNIVPNASFDLIAARDIFAGEELTLDYAAFGRVSEPPSEGLPMIPPDGPTSHQRGSRTRGSARLQWQGRP
jgi:hypothetical protein